MPRKVVTVSGDWRKKVRKVFGETLEERTAAPSLIRDFIRLLELFEKCELKHVREDRIVDNDARLVIEEERARIKVRGTDDRHTVIDDESLGMDERRSALKDPYTGEK